MRRCHPPPPFFYSTTPYHHPSSKPAAGSTVGQDCRCGPPNASFFCHSRRLHGKGKKPGMTSHAARNCRVRTNKLVLPPSDSALTKTSVDSFGRTPSASQADPDASDIIDAVRTFIRRQRNPLLDRISFYNRQQHRGELFDSFFTSLRELYHACSFTNTKLCDDCSTHACRECKTKLSQQQDEIMRDHLAIVVGISNDETRHKLLAISELTLAEAVKICHAEEAAVHTGQHIPPSTHTSTINAAKENPVPAEQAPAHPSAIT